MLRPDIHPGDPVKWRPGARGRWRPGRVRKVEHRGYHNGSETIVTIATETPTGYPEVVIGGDALRTQLRLLWPRRW